MVSFLTPDAPWDHGVIQGFCHFVLFFTSRQTGQQWIAKHEGTFLLSAAEAYEVGRRTNERQFATAQKRGPVSRGEQMARAQDEGQKKETAQSRSQRSSSI